MLRAAAYCRVSTDKDDQANSFESQQRYFRDYIGRNPEWDLVMIFAEEGISGTSTKNRKEFNNMIAAAREGRIDFILTKEVSRFARNTVDTLRYTRELKKLGVHVLFMNDNINTKDPDAELRLTIMASIAQEESRKTSERVKWGQKRRMEQGVVFGRDMLGYDVKDGRLFINEAGARTVRLIFHKFVEEGKSTYTIARELREAGIETAAHRKEWSNVAVLRALRNEKYCGDLVQKKTFTPDYLSHDRKYNRGEEELVVLRNHHEPIISRELFERAQRELFRRSPAPGQKAKYSSRYGLSGKIICGCCGSHFVSRARKRRDGGQYRVWRCMEAVRHGRLKIDAQGNTAGCPVGRQIRDGDFMRMIQMTVKWLRHDREQLIQELAGIVRTVLEEGDKSDLTILTRRAEAEAGKREKLIDLYLGGGISKNEFVHMSERYEKEKEDLRAKIRAAQKQKDMAGSQEELIQDITATIRALALGERQDDVFYRNIVEKIVVNSREHIEIYLNGLPYKWVYKPEGRNLLLTEHFNTDIPISVSSPATSR